MNSINGQTSLKAFCCALSLVLVVLLARAFHFSFDCLFPLSFLHLVAASFLFYFRCPSRDAFHVAVLSLFLGYVFVVGLSILVFVLPTNDWSWGAFGAYLCILSFFHYSEYYAISIVNPNSLSLDSFLLNHSLSYCVGIVSSFVEFLAEKYFFPDMKTFTSLHGIGIVVCIAGEVVRKAAMITACSGFNHVIQYRREEGHVLVTHGIYALFRHPAYVGYYYWCLGTQVLLANPICFVALNLASWTFFNNRIQSEEITLLNFFGEDYVQYQNRVPTGLPFIKGYRL